MDAKATIERLIKPADIKINGDRPWDITVHNPGLYQRVLRQGSLGLGEAYMDGWWDCDALDQFFDRLLRHDPRDQLLRNLGLLVRLAPLAIQSKLTNPQSRRRATQVGERHYDTGNDLFKAMLDPYMVYSCGHWKGATTLAAAQETKLELICRKLQLQPGMRLLDIGCGFGGLLRYAAEHYDVHGVGITISGEQAELAKKLCDGLPIEIKFQDYRDLRGQFDAVGSVGMFEHVGPKNHRAFMEAVARTLKPGGVALLHTIGANRSRSNTDRWINHYIFPNGVIPSLKQITGAAEGLLIPEDVQNFGPDYDPTLMAWDHNFEEAWPQLSQHNPHYDQRFYRMWRYYLLSCAGAFRARQIELYQVVLSHGRYQRYDAPR